MNIEDKLELLAASSRFEVERVGDFAPYMEACRVRNEERGRL